MAGWPRLGAVMLLVAAACGGCASFAGVNLSEPLDDDKQECVECALREQTDPENLAGAKARFREACNHGDPRSCSALGVMYEEGRGVERDTRRAESLYVTACLQGNGRACVNLGGMYEGAVNGPKDLDGAIVMYDLACNDGLAEGCFRLGRARYANGEVERAIKALRGSCKQQFAEACEALGTLYHHGHGVKRNLQRARSYFLRACRQGRTESCERLHDPRRPTVATAPEPYE